MSKQTKQKVWAWQDGCAYIAEIVRVLPGGSYLVRYDHSGLLNVVREIEMI